MQRAGAAALATLHKLVSSVGLTHEESTGTFRVMCCTGVAVRAAAFEAGRAQGPAAQDRGRSLLRSQPAASGIVFGCQPFLC